MHYHLCRHILAKKFIKKLAEISRCSLNIFVLDIFCVQIYLFYTFEKKQQQRRLSKLDPNSGAYVLEASSWKGRKISKRTFYVFIWDIFISFSEWFHFYFFHYPFVIYTLPFPFPFCFLLSFYKDNERLANYSRKLKIVNALTLPCWEQKVKTNAAFFLEYPYIHTWILT